MESCDGSRGEFILKDLIDQNFESLTVDSNLYVV